MKQKKKSDNTSCVDFIFELFDKIKRGEETPEGAKRRVTSILGGLEVYFPNRRSGSVARRIRTLIAMGRTNREIIDTIGCSKRYVSKIRNSDDEQNL